MAEDKLNIREFKTLEEFRAWWWSSQMEQFCRNHPEQVELIKSHHLVKPWLDKLVASPPPENATSRNNRDSAAAPQGGNNPHQSSPARGEGSDKGKSFGKYLIEKKLGEGGMGAVYLASDPSLNRKVALKVMTLKGKESAERFIREAQTAAQLVHPNILQVYEVGQVKNTHFIAMEYVAGGTLDDYWSKRHTSAKLQDKHPPQHPPLSSLSKGGLRGVDGSTPASRAGVRGRPSSQEIKEYLHLLRRVAEGIDYAHSQNIIHRDIKPENILLHQDKSGKTVAKVSDFGLAKDVMTEKKLTMAGTVVGTPLYMSPEQAVAAKLDRRSDVFSLGSVLYKLCTGAEPFMGKSSLDVMKAVVNKEPIAPSRLNRNIDRDVEVIILKTMSKERERRYQSAKELADDIERCLKGESIKARPASILYKTTKQLKRNKIAALSIAGVVVVLLIIGIARMSASSEQRGLILQYYLDAEELYDKGNYTEARAQANKVIGLEQDNRDALGLIAKCDKKLGEKQDTQTKAQERRAQAAGILRQLNGIANPSPQERIKIAQNALNIDPTFGEAWQVMGYAYKDSGQLDESFEAFTRAIELDPKLAYAYFERALLYHYIRNDKKSAMADYEMVAKLDPDGHFGYYGKGILEYEQGNYDRAIKHLTECINKQADFFRAYGSRGYVRIKKGDIEGAIKDFDKALQLSPRYSIAYVGRGTAKGKKGDHIGAIADYNKAIELNPKLFEVYFNRANARRELAERDYKNSGQIYDELMAEAMKDYDRAITLNPNDPDIYINRGVAKMFNEDRAGAVADYDKALQLDPNQSSAYFNRGVALYRMGKYEPALADLQKAIQMNPSNKTDLEPIIREIKQKMGK